MKNKNAAMEMTVGTIVTIVLLMSALVLGLILTKTIFTNTTASVDSINDQMKSQINDLFGTEGTSFVIRLGNQNTATVKQGTANFGIPIGFSPTLPAAWGPNKDNCAYTIKPNTQSECAVKGYWPIPTIYSSIKTGYQNVQFTSFQVNNGYAVIKIDVPATVAPCLQTFSIEVNCKPIGTTSYLDEYVRNSFDIEVIKKGIF
jgi:hypothetical protein